MLVVKWRRALQRPPLRTYANGRSEATPVCLLPRRCFGQAGATSEARKPHVYLVTCAPNAGCPLNPRKQTSRETYKLTCTKPLGGKQGDCRQFKPELPGFWESREVRGRLLSTRPLIASSSDASAERDGGHQASQPSRTGHRDGRGIPYRAAIHTQDRST